MRPSWSGFQFPIELPLESIGGRLNQVSESAMVLDVGLTIAPGLMFPAEFPCEFVASSAALSVTVDVTGKTDTDPMLVDVGIKKTELAAVLLDVGISRFELSSMVLTVLIHVLRSGYQVQLLDSTGNLVALLDPISPEYRRRQNQATSFSFGVLADDTRIQKLQAARHCTLYRDGVEKTAGYITARDFTSNPYRIECMTNEALLRRSIAPRAWKGWNNWDLADAVKDLTLGFKTQTKNTGDDWLAAVDKSNVDVLTWPGRVVLAKDVAGAYVPHGYITVQFDMGQITRYDLLRWSEDVGEATRIRAQFRTSPDAVNWSAWSVELSSVYPDEDGVALTGSDRYIQVRFHLYTDDTTTEDQNEVPTGYTPMLLGCEVIARTPGPVTVGNIPVSTGSIVQGYTFDRENALRILQTWCEDYGYEFYVDGEKKLHFARQLGQTKNVVLKRTSTMNVQRLSDNADEIKNVVTCLGAGSGSAQLQVVLRDEESIQAYGELPGVFQDTSCETLESLTTAGQKYLAANAWPKEEFMVTSVPVWEMEDFGLYDTVTVVDPLRGVKTSARILDEERKLGKSGEEVTLGLNTTLDNIIERIVKKQMPRPPRAPLGPGMPWALTITPGIKMLRLRWSGQADYYIIEHSLDGVAWSVLEPYWSGITYTHSGIEPGTVRYYRVRGVLGRQVSDPAGPVHGEPGDVALPDEEPPAVPSGLTLSTGLEYVGQITWSYIVASWTASDPDTAHYLVRYRRVGQSADQWQHSMTSGTTQKLTPVAGNVSYEVQARAVDTVGNASAWSSSKTITTARDTSAPAPPVFEASGGVVKGLYVVLRTPTEEDWDGFEIHVSEAGSGFTPGPSTLKARGRQTRFEITGLVPGRTYYVKAISYDTSGNKSAPAY